MSRRPPVAVARAGRLVGTPAARELVPTVPGQSARWHIHDYPGPYCRWNYHPQYEIHLIQHSSGRFIVGDCIDTFAAGQLTLIGSNLPHHWISDTVPVSTSPTATPSSSSTRPGSPAADASSQSSPLSTRCCAGPPGVSRSTPTRPTPRHLT
jgi:hypothetical protein